jgi:hypothetical protein
MWCLFEKMEARPLIVLVSAVIENIVKLFRSSSQLSYVYVITLPQRSLDKGLPMTCDLELPSRAGQFSSWHPIKEFDSVSQTLCMLNMPHRTENFRHNIHVTDLF